MDKIVSVVVTCYNHDKYIEECLRSVFKQTYQHIKLLVFNDGSTDGSETVIQSVLTDSPFEDTQYFYHDNQGIVRTRNRALEMIDSDYVLFVDSDNALEDNYVEALLAVAEEQNGDIVYATFKNLETQEVILATQDFQLERLYADNFIESCSLIRTPIIGDCRYDVFLNHQRLEDYDFFLNLIVNKGARAVPCKSTFLHYRVLEDSRSSRTDIGKYYDVYAYILGKYFAQNISYGKEALKLSVKRLYDYLMNIRSDYQLTLFYDRGNGFSEEDKVTWPLAVKGEVTFSLDNDVQRIRIDLGELPNYFKKISLFDKNHRPLTPNWTNGFKENGYYFFTTSDPQLIYDIGDKHSEGYSLSYEMFNLYSQNDGAYINELLSKELEEKTKALSESEIIREQYCEIQNTLEKTRNKLHELECQYDSVVGSRRWKITTKLINFFRREK